MLLSRPGLRRDFAVRQDLQRAAHDRERLRDRRAPRRRPPAGRAFDRRLAAAREVLVGDELVAVALQDDARERAAADDEHLLVVLLQLFDERQEVAVAADDDVGVDVLVGERHLERVEREVDVGAVLVAAGRQVALHEADGVLREVPAVFAGARPVGVGDLGDDLAALLDGVEDDADVEVLVEGGLDADFDVVEVDEDGDVETILMRQNESLQCRECESGLRPTAAGVFQPSLSQRSSRAASEATCSPIVRQSQRRGRFRRRPEDARELAALQELAPLAAAAGHLVFRRADRLFGAAASFRPSADRGRRVEAMKPSTRSSSPSLIRMHALARARTGSSPRRPCRACPRASAVAAIRISPPVSFATPTTSAPFGRPREPAARARARFDERLEAEAQA